ncbi:Ascorbate-specific phosphotransferase enzyme IIA component [Sarcina ventriculi]|uniref:PTS sugar transporter subunit IIA n=1 Tax=Candidatus Sarcina troglodytae TaxID=2726954 RepID=A0ACD1BB75_9CLOT|nr:MULTISPECIES: PTS sugar transporter subunit IIA [Sarcina]MDD7372772.1 PTS sugar transporter subunit IIA [Sarcina ventriculi]MDO4402490.1 PTS sugar transporter subunit IIA [Clostridiaceae bacterium]QPJ84670.1 PTS sugar transporter subunit IIA [Sarcina sp. JB2]SPZ49336.1 Ascorbate-specific phosphotransferase enzyme IIA component [Sarcina ventriculi]
MLKEIIEKKRYSFHQGFDNWEDAVKAACTPLVLQKAIEEEYSDLIIQSIKKHGPYIVIAPKIAIPHAQEGKAVNETSICFMKTNTPVSFGDSEEYDAQLFFVLASVDNEVHLKNLTKMVELISDEEVVDKLLNAKSVEDLKKLI